LEAEADPRPSGDKNPECENRDIRATLEPTQLPQPSQAKREFYLRRQLQFAEQFEVAASQTALL
jgi:hypothetical protein